MYKTKLSLELASFSKREVRKYIYLDAMCPDIDSTLLFSHNEKSTQIDDFLHYTMVDPVIFVS